MIRLAALLLLAALPALADVGGTRACLDAQEASGAPVSDCVNEAHRACASLDETGPAAAECFVGMKAAWGAAISARMDEIAARATPEVNQIAGIETRFDLMQNLLQCDRLEALSLVTDQPSEGIAFQRVRCEATATGLAYVKLLLQSRSVDAPAGGDLAPAD